MPIYWAPGIDLATHTGYRASLLRLPVPRVGDGVAVDEMYYYPSATIYPVTYQVRWTPSGYSHLSAGSLTGATEVRAVSSRGVMVSSISIAGNQICPVRWDSSGQFGTLDTLGISSTGSYSGVPYDVNQGGVVVGESTRYDGGVDRGVRAVTWSPALSQPVELPAFSVNASGDSSSSARAISDSGYIAGQAVKYENDISKGSRVVRWDSAGNVTEMQMPWADSSGAASGYPVGICEDGTMWGYCTEYNGNVALGQRAVRWDANGQAARLFGLNDGSLRIYGIGGDGVVVGEQLGGQYLRAIKWNAQSNTAIELLDFGDGPNGIVNSGATDINNSGFIVGYCLRYSAASQKSKRVPVLWTPAGIPIDLNAFLTEPDTGDVLSGTLKISDGGWISGLRSSDPEEPPGAYTTRPFLLNAAFTGSTPGDANDNGTVDSADFAILVTHYGAMENSLWIMGDFNADGRVNTLDFNVLAGNFGNSAALPAATVPEPLGGIATALGTIFAFRRARSIR